MALRRRGERGAGSLIWPGFVDAMTALLLVLMFVLSMFMIVQFVLREEISGKDSALQDLSAQLGALTSQLSLAEQETEYYQAELQSLTGLLDEERQRAADLSSALDEEAAKAAQLSSDLEARILEISALSSSLAQSESQTDELSTLVAVLTDERDAAQVALADLQDRSEALARTENENVGLRAQLAELTAAQAASVDALAAAEQELSATREAAAQELAATRDAAAQELAAARDAAAQELAAARDAAARDLEEVRQAAAQAFDEARAAASRDLAAVQARLDETGAELARAQGALDERDAAAIERDAALEAIRRKLAEAENRERQTELTLGEKIAALELALDKKREEAEETLLLLAAADSKRKELEDQTTSLNETNAEQLETMTRRELAAAFARAQLQSEREISEQGRRAVALLNTQVRQLRNEIAGLRLQLDASEERDAENQVVIQDLGARLNKALAAKVGELQRYRSEFFGRMREALGERSDISVVGDRFVFQSEVLFGTGEARLGVEGRTQLSRLAAAIRDIQDDIPADLDWLLRIDGHTDKVPVSGFGRFRNNWELSQARALSVVDYLINTEGLPAKRLAAAGFGEHQPIDEGDSEEALGRNRRIEMRLTER